MTSHAELQRLDTQLRLAFEGPAWHGPSVLESLAGVTAEQASAHPVAGAHSIWELVLHIAAGHRLVLRRLKGDGSPLTDAEDWPPVPEPTQANWDDAVGSLRALNRELRSAVLAFDPAGLDRPLVPEPPYSAYTQFIGLTQHDLYHAGQIAILKKALVAGANPDRGR
jgi:uncharacterized damage-inducible protein DinB